VSVIRVQAAAIPGPSREHLLLCYAGNPLEGDVMLRKLIMLTVLAGFIAGCNTMQGVGKDVERGGEKLQGAAERNK
jgi:predicted small secreted protein